MKSKNLLLSNRHIIGNIREDGWFYKKSSFSPLLSTNFQFSTLFNAQIYVFQDFLLTSGIDLRSFNNMAFKKLLKRLSKITLYIVFQVSTKIVPCNTSASNGFPTFRLDVSSTDFATNSTNETKFQLFLGSRKTHLVFFFSLRIYRHKFFHVQMCDFQHCNFGHLRLKFRLMQ